MRLPLQLINLIVIRAVILVSALWLTACSQPTLTPLAKDAVILAFGDSLTVGVGTATENSYPNVLATLTGRTVINAGVSGETTDEGLKRLPSVLTQTQPDLLILIEGGNDILQNKPYDQIQENLSKMITLAQQNDIPVVLIGVPEKKLFSDAAPFYEALAKQYKIVFEGELLGDLLRTAALKSDPIHLNTAGYQQMAEGIHALLSQEGAL